ncbi:MAG: ATP-binding cassette domain-containing protein [Anaeromyxobacter sp.]
MGVLLEMVGISKEFPGVRALDDVSLTVRAGTVHALMGENGAGKSTLMKILFGLYHPDRGEIRLEGRPLVIGRPKEALDNGISMIHQELHPIPHRSVMENIWLGRFPQRKLGPIPFVDHRAMYRDTAALFKGLGITIDPAARLGSLSLSKIQSGGDRQGGLVQVQGHHHGRAHLLAHRGGGGAPVPDHQRPALARLRHHLHLAQDGGDPPASPTRSPSCATAGASAPGRPPS